MMSLPNFDERVKAAWPAADPDDCLALYPIGSRRDMLIFWRTEQRVTTGVRGTGPCYEGSLEEFAEKMESDYGSKLAGASGARIETVTAHREDYRQVVRFLAALGKTPVGNVYESEGVAYG
jgi:hypothetical protein